MREKEAIYNAMIEKFNTIKNLCDDALANLTTDSIVTYDIDNATETVQTISEYLDSLVNDCTDLEYLDDVEITADDLHDYMYGI